jgi:hypothetical protein
VRRVARKFDRPDWFLTGWEIVVLWLSTLGGLILGLAVAPYLFAVALPAWVVGMYRSLRRSRAARRAGLDGFVSQAAQVGDEERERKVEAIRRELGDWRPGLRWLAEVDARAAGRYR